MAERDNVLVPSETTQGTAPIATTVQQVHSISAGPHGNAVLAGRDVSVHHHHYPHGPHQQAVNIDEVLRLVPNLRKIHLDVLSKATPGTAVWILKTKHFQLWLDPNGTLKILWGSGIPGAGKSVMASVVISDLEKRAEASGGSICFAYVYFRYSDAVDLTVRKVLEILVKQIVERHTDCAALAAQVYARHLKEKTQPTQAELLQLLHQFTEAKSATFYVLDALDEAPEKLRLDIVRTLATLNAKLFITSRPLKSIEAKFSNAHSFNIVAQEHDLNLHIAQEISRCEELQDLLDADPSFKEEVITSIKGSCGGMFLHASLQLDAISRCNTSQDILETLAEFPSDIRDVYHLTWTRILSQTTRNVAMAKAVLVWVLHAARSMTIEELRHAIATHPDTHAFEPKRLASTAALMTVCCGLLVVEEETKLVRLIHYTAKDTLDGLLRESFPHPHLLLNAVCITHLAKCGFQDTTMSSEDEFDEALQNDPLLSYASHAWSTHARSTLDLPESRQRTETFVSKCRAFPSFTDPNQTHDFDILTSLHVLAAHHLPFDLAADDVVAKPNIATRSHRMTPLMLAAWHNNPDMARTLLALGRIEVNLTNTDGVSALDYAARQGNDDLVNLLVAHPDTQVNLVDNKGWSALITAANQGHEGIVRLLLARTEIQVNLVDNEGWSALMLAAGHGHEGLVRLLLAHPDIQVNLVNNEGWSALMLAANHGHEGVVRLLLARPDIQVNLVDNEGWSALMKAANAGHEGVVRLLFAHPEVQVNLVNNEGWSALMLAAGQGHEGVVRLLLARPDIQVNVVDNEGWSALMLAAGHGHEGVVRLLLAHPDIQVNLVDNEQWSALMKAAGRGREGIVRLLLAHPDIQVNLVDNEGWSALMMAAGQGHEGIVRLLVAHPDIQVNPVDNKGWSALMIAAKEGHEGVVRLLLAHPDIQVNLVDNEQWSALMKAAGRGREGIVRLLLAHLDIQVNLVDNEGWSALMEAASRGHEGVVRLLLAHPDIQVNLVGNKGWSALMLAASHGHEGVVRLLLARPDVQVNLVDNEGWSALMRANGNGHQDVAQLLIDHSKVQATSATPNEGTQRQ